MIGLSIAVTQPELADLLNDLAEEENQHARQVEMMRNFFLQSPDSFLETPEAERTIAEFVQNLDTIRNYLNQH
jgi:rubrerythrin